MSIRPRTKAYKKSKYRRCPKCQKLLRLRVRRCKTCHLLQVH